MKKNINNVILLCLMMIPVFVNASEKREGPRKSCCTWLCDAFLWTWKTLNQPEETMAQKYPHLSTRRFPKKPMYDRHEGKPCDCR